MLPLDRRDYLYLFTFILFQMMPEAFSFTMDVIEGKRKAARNDNEYVYHEKVPPLDTLPELKGR